MTTASDCKDKLNLMQTQAYITEEFKRQQIYASQNIMAQIQQYEICNKPYVQGGLKKEYTDDYINFQNAVIYSAAKQMVTKPNKSSSNIEWLDKRINEMRVKL